MRLLFNIDLAAKNDHESVTRNDKNMVSTYFMIQAKMMIVKVLFCNQILNSNPQKSSKATLKKLKIFK